MVLYQHLLKQSYSPSPKFGDMCLNMMCSPRVDALWRARFVHRRPPQKTMMPSPKGSTFNALIERAPFEDLDAQSAFLIWTKGRIHGDCRCTEDSLALPPSLSSPDNPLPSWHVHRGGLRPNLVPVWVDYHCSVTPSTAKAFSVQTTAASAQVM